MFLVVFFAGANTSDPPFDIVGAFVGAFVGALVGAFL